MAQEKRWRYLDAIKTLAIACVCLYHFCWQPDGAFFDPTPVSVMAERWLWGMNSVFVPLFMMVNGALVLNRRFDAKKHFTRWGCMIAGMFVWFMLTQALVHGCRHGAGYVLSNFAGMLESALYLYGYDGVTMDHLWFVQMLLALYLLLPMIHAAFNSPDAQYRRALMPAVVLLAAFSFIPHDYALVSAYIPVLRSASLNALETINPARNGVYGAMMVYFILGGCLHRHAQKTAQMKWRSCALLFAAGSALLFVQWYLMTRKNEAVYDIVYNGYNCTATLMMSTAIFAAAMKLEPLLAQSKRIAALLGLIGRNTMAVYYLHWILGNVLRWGSRSLPIGLAHAAVMVILCALLGEGMRRIPGVRRMV